MMIPPKATPGGSDVPTPDGRARCRFGLFELDLDTRELRCAGRPVHLAPQPTRVLIALALRSGQIVTRQELKDFVWGGTTFVDFEQGLNFCMKQIRAALGDSAENPRFIETLPRRGYRLIAPTEWIARPGPAEPLTPPAIGPPAAAPSRTAVAVLVTIGVLVAVGGGYLVWAGARRVAARPPRAMVAVLPFENLSADRDQEYFSDGFTEELIAQLGRLDPARLGVIARRSTLVYRRAAKSAPQIGSELGVQHFVEGTVRRSGNRVRINAQLVRVADQSHVWTGTYEGEVRDVLTMQHEVGNEIARQILATLNPASEMRARTVDPAVYDLYLRGRFSWNRRRGPETEKAIASFTEVVRRDPTFAPAYAGLADSLLVGSRPAALTAAEKALSLDDRLAEAHAAKGHALMHMLQWGRAEEAFRRAIALDASYVPARYFYSEFLLARGRCAEARDQALRGLAIDPLSALAAHVVGVTLYYCRDYDGALPYFRQALDLDPEHQWSHYRLGLALEQRRSYDAALAELTLVPVPIARGYTYAVAGRPAAARRLVREALAGPNPEIDAFLIAETHVGLGEHDEALEWLTLVVRKQLYQAVFLHADPRLDALRPRPDFQALLREAGWD